MRTCERANGSDDDQLVLVALLCQLLAVADDDVVDLAGHLHLTPDEGTADLEAEPKPSRNSLLHHPQQFLQHKLQVQSSSSSSLLSLSIYDPNYIFERKDG